MATRSRFWVVFENLCLSDVNTKPNQVLHMVDVLREERPLKDKEIAKEFAQRFKKWFASTEERWVALCFMPTCLKYFNAELLQQNAVFWMKSLVHTFNSEAEGHTVELVLSCVQKLLSFSVKFDEISRDFALNLIHPFLTTLISYSNSETRFLGKRLIVYKQCVLCYPGPTGRFRNQIENQCLSFMSHYDDSLRLKACQCLAVLPRCGTSGEKGSKFAEFWSKQFCSTLNTIKELVEGTLFSNIEKAENKDSSKMTLRIPKILFAQPQNSITFCRQVTSLLFVLEEMIRYQFPSMVNVNLQYVVSICSKILSKQADFEDSSIESVCVNAIIPHLWSSCLSLMNTVVMQMGSLALPHKSDVTDMVMQALSFAQRNGNACSNEYPSMKKEAYKLFANWITLIGEVTAEETSRIIELILHDVQQMKEIESSVAKQTGGKQKKQKHGKRLQEDFVESAMVGKKKDRPNNIEIAMPALELLQTLIESLGSRMTLESVLKIESLVVAVCIDISEASCQASGSFFAPYGSAECRKQILKCAFSLLSLYHYQLPTPVSTFVSIFQHGLNDPSFSVSSDCKHYLYLSDRILHPSVPALRVFVENNEQKVHMPKQKDFLGQSCSFDMFDNQKLFLTNHRSQDIDRPQYTGLSLSQEFNHSQEMDNIQQGTLEKSFSLDSRSVHVLENDKKLRKGSELKSDIEAKTEGTDCMETDNEIPSPCSPKEICSEEASIGSDNISSEVKEIFDDRHPNDDWIEPKRPRLDERLEDDKEEKSPKEKQTESNKETKETYLGSMNREEDFKSVMQVNEEAATIGDDETSLLLKSFVNSLPDSD